MNFCLYYFCDRTLLKLDTKLISGFYMTALIHMTLHIMLYIYMPVVEFKSFTLVQPVGNLEEKVYIFYTSTSAKILTEAFNLNVTVVSVQELLRSGDYSAPGRKQNRIN